MTISIFDSIVFQKAVSVDLTFQITFNHAAGYEHGLIGNGDVESFTTHLIVTGNGIAKNHHVEIAMVAIAFKLTTLTLHGSTDFGQHAFRIFVDRYEKFAGHIYKVPPKPIIRMRFAHMFFNCMIFFLLQQADADCGHLPIFV